MKVLAGQNYSHENSGFRTGFLSNRDVLALLTETEPSFPYSTRS